MEGRGRPWVRACRVPSSEQLMRPPASFWKASLWIQSACIDTSRRESSFDSTSVSQSCTCEIEEIVEGRGR